MATLPVQVATGAASNSALIANILKYAGLLAGVRYVDKKIRGPKTKQPNKLLQSIQTPYVPGKKTSGSSGGGGGASSGEFRSFKRRRFGRGRGKYKRRSRRVNKRQAYRMSVALLPWHETIQSGPVGSSRNITGLNIQDAVALHSLDSSVGALGLPQLIVNLFTLSREETGSTDIPLSLPGTWLYFKQRTTYSFINRTNTSLHFLVLMCVSKIDQESSVVNPGTDWVTACSVTQKQLNASTLGSVSDPSLIPDRPWYYSNWTGKWKILYKKRLLLNSGDVGNVFCKVPMRRFSYDRLSSLVVLKGYTIFPLVIAYPDLGWTTAADTVGQPAFKYQVTMQTIYQHKILPVMQPDTVSVQSLYNLPGTAVTFNPYTELPYNIATN